jgi:hypothetical protein
MGAASVINVYFLCSRSMRVVARREAADDT